MEFKKRLWELKSLIDTYIQKYLLELEFSMKRPGLLDLYTSLSYSLAHGGSRIRPLLSLLTAEALGGSYEDVLALGSAVELIHTYSLIHDDLPSMDNDDFRRGKPSNHKVFGEAMAVLAGDALNNEAFFLLAKAYNKKPQLGLDLITELALAAGAQGMVGGQAADIIFRDRDVSEPEIEFLHMYKTGALFRVSILGAARICNANGFELKCLSDYGRNFGLVFQIADDINDGHKTDEPSFLKTVGLKKAHEICEQLVARAESSVEPLGEKAQGLKDLVKFMYERVKT